ncbi:HAMP domain-containing histidine kinase [Clostridium sp. YIM B02505]|uniref:histidine kinase n=1 Tax=Clostridium yunnanense TaxID=2800325 RepID=A0ABS1EK05_9CLOT|nr:HAMP domain-containing sensor histidine kinase [Clostridium yunnanense]MBK1809694.1 HAMP domain-containing histidine kinase [Clostridium yunnanense]
MELFNNREIKRFTFKFAFLFCLLLIVVLALNLHTMNNLNKEIIRQNISVVGALVKENPQSEENIVKNFTRNYEKDYEYGLDVLNKYSYNETLEAYKNPVMMKAYGTNIRNMLIVLTSTGAVIYLILLLDIGQILKKIKEFSLAAERIVEGDFSTYFDADHEGDIYILGHQFNQMTIRLRESIEKLNKEKLNLKDIIADITHQLKTPLASLITFNEIMRGDQDMDQQEKNKFLNMSKSQLDRMEWLIKSLLKLARLDAGVINFNMKKNKLKDTVFRALEGIEVKAKAKNIEVMVTGDESSTLIHDKEWTGEAISNIIKNAVEHGREDGYVKIHWEDNPLFIEFNIEDNGEGISEDELPRIFERFYKGQSSTNPSSIGIGLYISKNIIEAQNGNIRVESKEGYGTKFTITFLKHVI